jgi:hypothetical protein
MSNKRLGYHYYPDDRHFSQDDLGIWLPRLHALGAKWLTLRCPASRAIPEPFVRGLLDASIQPVIHITSSIGTVQASDLTSLFSSYSRWGVRYVVVFDRPNLKQSWGEASWTKRGLVERYLDNMLPILEASRAVGLRPTLPPLEPGGDYWDTAFLELALAGIARRGKHDLLQDLTLGIYAWTYNRPLDWGLGGPERWPEARPYHTPLGCQDQLGLRIFDWYDSISRRILQSPIPMLVVAGGAFSSDPQHALIAPDVQAEQNLSIARALESETIPPQVLNFSFYPLMCTQDHPDYASAWFPADGPPRPVVDALHRYVGIPESAASPHNKPHKAIDHYVLLPENTGPGFHRRWATLGALVAASKPVIGFSSDVARSARRVTIIGDEALVPARIEAELRSAGCEVQRVPHLAAPLQSSGHRQGTNTPLPTGALNARD